VALDPTYQQLSILTVVPGLPRWNRLRRDGRVPEDVSWRDSHLYGRTFSHPHFGHQDMLDLLERAYRRIYLENGAPRGPPGDRPRSRRGPPW